jgi:hypothetical protein
MTGREDQGIYASMLGSASKNELGSGVQVGYHRPDQRRKNDMVARVRSQRFREPRKQWRRDDLRNLSEHLHCIDEARVFLNERVQDLYADFSRVPSLRALWRDFMAAGGVTRADLWAYYRGEPLRDVRRAPHPDFRLIVSNPAKPFIPAEPPPAKPAQRRRVA